MLTNPVGAELDGIWLVLLVLAERSLLHASAYPVVELENDVVSDASLFKSVL